MIHRGIVSQLKSRGIIAKAYASGIHKDNYDLEPNNALFDNSKTFHSTVAWNQWLLVDFSKNVLIDSYSIKSPGTTGCISNWDLEVSKNNDTFYPIDSKRGEIPQTETKYEMYKPNMSVKTRYVRLYSKGLAYKYEYSQIYLKFINFYGDPLFSCSAFRKRQFRIHSFLLMCTFLI